MGFAYNLQAAQNRKHFVYRHSSNPFGSSTYLATLCLSFLVLITTEGTEAQVKRNIN